MNAPRGLPGPALPRAWARLVAHHPWGVLLGAALLTGLAMVRVTQARDFLRTARLDLIGRDVGFVEESLALEAEFGDLEAIVVALRGDDPAATRACARALAARAQADGAHFSIFFCPVAPAELGGRALLWLPPAALERAADAAARMTPALLHEGTLCGLFLGLAGELRAASQALPSGDGDPPGAALLGHKVEALLAALEGALRGEEPAAAPLGELLGFEEHGWTWTRDRRTLILLVNGRDLPGDMDPKGPAVAALRALAAELAPAHPGVHVELTGKPVLQVDEMATYARDSARSSAAALVLVVGLLVLALRRLLAPALIGLCLLLAVVWTLGAVTVWPGHLNLLAVVFVVIVIGLGVDYGIHVVARYDWERARGQDPAQALAAAFAATGSALGVAGFTTVLAFAACFLCEFRGLREFGAVAGFGVMAAGLASASVLPALLVLLDRGRPLPLTPGRPTPLDRAMGALDRLTLRRPGLLLGLVGLLTLLAALLTPRTRWEPSLIALQDPNLPSVQLSEQLLRDEQLSSWFMAWSAPDLGELRRAAARARALAEVHQVESVLDALPPEQERGVPLLARLQAAVAPLLSGSAPPAPAPERLAAALQAWESACEELADTALGAGRGQAVARLEGWRTRAAAARVRLLQEGAGRTAALEDGLRAQLLDLARFVTAPAAAPLGPAELPASLRARLIGRSGGYLLRILPRGDMWDPVQLARFVAAVKGELPRATGVPELVLESSRMMVAGYRTAGAWALVAVLACLLVYFRSLPAALLALLALGLGALWTAGLLGLTGTTLNPANLVALPLLVGVGVDSAVHVIHRGREAGSTSLLGASLGRALVYSALTSVAGFGSLLLSHHRGTASIGSTTSVGVLSCLLAALLVPPPLLALWRRRRPPVATGAPPSSSSENQPTG